MASQPLGRNTMTVNIYLKEDTKGLTVAQLIESLAVFPSDAPVCIVTSSDTAYTLERPELITAHETPTNKNIKIVRLHI